MGYSSDICRSFFIPPPSKSIWHHLRNLVGISYSRYPVPTPRDPDLYTEKLKVWDIVFQAQTEAAKMFKPNNTAADVDIAARKVIDEAGYKGTFTHRLGHGIGIKGTSFSSGKASCHVPLTHLAMP